MLSFAKSFNIRMKLTISFLLVISIFLGFAAVSYQQMIGISKETSSLARSSDFRNKVQRLAELSRDEYINTSNLVVNIDTAITAEKYIEKHKKISSNFRDTLSQLEKEYTDKKSKEAFLAIRSQETNFESILIDKLLPDYKAHDNDQIHRWNVELTGMRDAIIGLTDNFNEIIQTEQNNSSLRIQGYIKKAAQNVLVGIIIALFIGLLVAFIASDMIVKPMNILINYSRRIAEGDLSTNISVNGRKDEVGKLMNAFNLMHDALSEMIRVNSNISNQVAASSEELAASTEQVGDTGKQVTIVVKEIATGSIEQFERIRAATESISGLLERVKMVTLQAQEMNQAVSRVVERVNDGNRSVVDAVKQMDRVALQVKTSSDVIEKLGKRSEEVGQIVDVITVIAGQTKLLSLNAAIEAARAGDQGKGFAVVADEVRKLAEQSAKSSGLISEMIREIQNDTKAAVQAMTYGKHEADSGNRVIIKAGEKFNDINEEIQLLTGHINKLAISAGDMDASGQKTGFMVRDIAAITEKSVAGSQQASSEMLELLRAVEEITSASSDLASMAEELVDTSAKFKL